MDSLLGVRPRRNECDRALRVVKEGGDGALRAAGGWSRGLAEDDFAEHSPLDHHVADRGVEAEVVLFDLPHLPVG